MRWIILTALAAGVMAQDEKQIDELIGKLKDDAVATRNRAERELTALGEKALPLLKQKAAAATDPEAISRLETIIRDIEGWTDLDVDMQTLLQVVYAKTQRSYATTPDLHLQQNRFHFVGKAKGPEGMQRVLDLALQRNGLARVTQPDGTDVIFAPFSGFGAPVTGTTRTMARVLDSDPTEATAEWCTRVYRVKNGVAVRVAMQLRMLWPQTTVMVDGEMVAITDYAANLIQIGKLIAQFDVPSGFQYRMIRLKHAKASELAPMIAKLITDTKSPNVPGGPPSEPRTAVADERTNSVLLACDQQTFTALEDLMRQVDVPLDK